MTDETSHVTESSPLRKETEVARDNDSLRDPLVRRLATVLWREKRLKDLREKGAVILPQEVVYLGLLAQSVQAQIQCLDAVRYSKIPLRGYSVVPPWEDSPEGTRAAQAFLDGCLAAPPRDVTEADLQGWLQIDREKLARLTDPAHAPKQPTALRLAEIDMVQATIGQLEAELRYVAVQKQHEASARAVST